MGNINATPVVSQVVSAVQAIRGDLKGAKETQEQFSKRCPVISQLRSAVEGTYDVEAANQTQTEFIENMKNVNASAIPVVSQIVSAVQATRGDLEGATETQQQFSKLCPVISQLRSAVEATFDMDAANQTQECFIEHLKSVADATLSQFKEAVKQEQGETEDADEAPKLARTPTETAVVVIDDFLDAELSAFLESQTPVEPIGISVMSSW